MKSTHTVYLFLAVIGILGWNAFAIQRDAKQFKAYDEQKARIEFCSSQAGWHPDCNTDRIYKKYYEPAVKSRFFD